MRLVVQVASRYPGEVSVSGPFDRWPTGSGFDKFWGFITNLVYGGT